MELSDSIDNDYQTSIDLKEAVLENQRRLFLFTGYKQFT